MSFDEIWIHVVATLREHAVKLVTGFVLMAVGWYIGKRRATAHWKKQEFFDRLNVSLNTIDGGGAQDSDAQRKAVRGSLLELRRRRHGAEAGSSDHGQ